MERSEIRDLTTWHGRPAFRFAPCGLQTDDECQRVPRPRRRRQYGRHHKMVQTGSGLLRSQRRNANSLASMME
jgi:hypothetical protein